MRQQIYQMCGYSSHSLRGVSPIVYSIPTLIPFPLFVGKPYTTCFIDVQIITLRSLMYMKAYFLYQCHTTKLTNSEKKNENYDCKL